MSVATGAPAKAAGTEFTVPTRLFGPIRVSPELCIVFPDGLLGFAGERRFVLLPAAPEGIYWLQSVEQSELAFLLVDPFPLFDGYAVELADEAAGAAADRERLPPLVLAMVTLPRLPGQVPTANLQGPLVIDLAERRGRQVIQADPRWGTQAPFELNAGASGGAR